MCSLSKVSAVFFCILASCIFAGYFQLVISYMNSKFRPYFNEKGFDIKTRQKL